MIKKFKLSSLYYFLLLIVLVISLSFLFTNIWGGEEEGISKTKDLIIKKEMSIKEFGTVNDLPNPVLKEVFKLKSSSQLSDKITKYGSKSEILSMTTKQVAISSEKASKDWRKIVLKFLLWIIFLSSIFYYLKKNKINSKLRKGLLFLSVMIFGIILGSDPGPMGTVKDAIHLFATTKAIFPPRMIALTVFLLGVFLANKYICSWGCQAGTLQDLIFRLNRDEKYKTILGKQYKLPFVLTNTIRILYFSGFTIIAFLWGSDIIAPIDIFKIYSPAPIGIAGGIFIAVC